MHVERFRGVVLRRVSARALFIALAMGTGDIDKQSLGHELPNPVEQPSARLFVHRAIIDDNQPHRGSRESLATDRRISQISIFHGARAVFLINAVSSRSAEKSIRVGAEARFVSSARDGVIDDGIETTRAWPPRCRSRTALIPSVVCRILIAD